MGAVMSHMGARILTVLREDRPYEIRDIDGKPISREEAWKFILWNYKVPKEIKRERRRKTTNALLKRQAENRKMTSHRTNEAAATPQPASLSAISDCKSNSVLLGGQQNHR